MSASRRPGRRFPGPGLWSRALEIRNSWLSHALSTEPADRPAAEAAITRLYELAGASPPTFSWTSSPAAAVAVMPPAQALSLGGDPPVEARLASRVASLRERLDLRIGAWRDRYRLPDRPPPDPLAVPLRALLNNGLGPALRRSVRDSVAGALRGELTTGSGLYWGGQHEAHWVALYDLHRRVDGVRFAPDDARELDLWATLARSCGWWWPREGVCVIAERPLVVRTERVDDAYGLVRLHHETGPVIAFPDSWTVHAWHGTRVPSWVIDAPSADRIMAERNVEVRRCAIERVGWPAFVAEAGLELLGRAGDPGNPGCELRLYDGSATRLLLVVNGSVERDGTRRHYGLRVPAELDHPLDAAGWTYGLTGAQYARLRRRT
ncbi:hypothetical protein Amsp01_010460 [Amycolatopsis sp. NBRC 101858]|uniref:DUF6745 domain-containing protein n=1 Tax=Amycolatopsis sp. NBRC 101858 TaxID=3032200 RepID=UPI0024A035C2|nr:hypothetical protein [Amycolatopsis sp. NBRC 101858]GLY35022.1 hypothetical protein Amsp01_010460 [Amycolatopsis sp. NBRC 101858]